MFNRTLLVLCLYLIKLQIGHRPSIELATKLGDPRIQSVNRLSIRRQFALDSEKLFLRACRRPSGGGVGESRLDEGFGGAKLGSLCLLSRKAAVCASSSARAVVLPVLTPSRMRRAQRPSPPLPDVGFDRRPHLFLASDPERL